MAGDPRQEGVCELTTTERGCCARCGAWLRRARPRAAELCDPCRRVGPDLHRVLPAGFYFQDSMVAALAAYDFGFVFRRVRAHTGWSQQTLGELVGLDQTRVSEIERGKRRLRDVALVARVVTGLRIPPILLGFGDPGTTVDDAQKVVNWMDRRDFTKHVATLALGAAGVAGLDIDRLIALLPHTEPTGVRHVGAADVEVIEQATAAFVRQDFATGSGPVREVAVAQLRATLPLLGAQVTPEVRPRLYLATARLAMQAGWMSFQVNQDEAARRLWMIALDIARVTDHPLGSDLTVYLLYDMALQAVHVGRPDETLDLVRAGHAVGVGAYPVSPSTTSLLASIQALAHAAKGDSVACDRALGQAEEHFNAIVAATRPPWGAFLDETGLASYQGDIHYELALSTRDPRAAERAVPLLRHTVEHFGPDYARLQARDLTNLAGAHAIAGDLGTAVTVGHQALDAVAGLSSPRAYDQLRVLNTVLEPLHTSAGVAELRGRLATTAV